MQVELYGDVEIDPEPAPEEPAEALTFKKLAAGMELESNFEKLAQTEAGPHISPPYFTILHHFASTISSHFRILACQAEAQQLSDDREDEIIEDEAGHGSF